MSSSGSALYVSSSTSLPPWSDTSSAVESLVLLPKPYPMQPPSILHASFNQEADCFSVGTTEGFAVFDADPFSESFRRSFSSGGVSLVQMLFRYNILVLVAAPEPNKVMIWDDHLKKCVFALLFRSEVKAVRLRPDSILVVMLQKIYVYDFADFKLVHQIETMENPLGLCEVSQKGSMVVVCLGLQKGFVMVEHYAMRKSKHIMAHNSSVAFVALVNDGSLLATASSCGTLVRVFSTKDGSLLKELRRGSERAVICSLSFSADAQWLAVSSDKGTVHVFSLNIDPGYLRIACSDKAETNSLASYSVSRLSFIKGFLPNYFSSEWSVAQFHVKEGLQHAVGFGHQEHTVAIIGSDGRFYRCKFDPVVGGEMIQLESHSF